MKIILVTILVTLASTISSETVRYDKHVLYRIIPKDLDELNILKTLNNGKEKKCDFWIEPRNAGTPVDVMVPPERKHDIKQIISQTQMNYQIIMEDVQKQIDEEKQIRSESRRKNVGFDWQDYYTVDEINTWLNSLASQYPDTVTLVVGGQSYEGRNITGVKVSYSPDNKNRSVWIDSLIHAREWISGATNTYILNQILSSNDSTIRNLAESHDWYFFPVINPDGYQYTHTTNRLWRKTRKPYGICYGTDPNRNWGYKWNQGGSSNDPCDDTYAGPSAFSDIETKSLSEYMSTIANDLRLFITFHSYSQVFLLPYGHTTEHLDNYNVTYPVGVKAAEALSQRYGTKYEVGDIAELMYVATGSNLDWLKGNYQVPFGYACELRDTGRYGFLLPPEQIIPTGEETLDAILTMLQEADKILD